MCDIVCGVCFHHCRLKNGQSGLCRARKNENGQNLCLNYGKITSMALDPIEKKPLYMFYPGAKILSLGSFGCNLNCPFCQNDSISCADERTASWEYLSPGKLAGIAEGLKGEGNIGIAFTYNEPMIAWEFILDMAVEIKKRDMKNVVVTNGSVSLEILEKLLPYIDAFNIDLKGFTQAWYKKLGGDLQSVLDFIIRAAKGSHVELTTLIVPDENDSVEEMRHICEWIASVDKGIPLHITRFFPRRDMKERAPTDIALMRRLYECAREELPNVFLGNV